MQHIGGPIKKFLRSAGLEKVLPSKTPWIYGQVLWVKMYQKTPSQ